MGWQPKSPALVGDQLQEIESIAPVVAIHCWAEWDAYDRKVDAVIQGIRSKLTRDIDFYSCDCDNSENWEWLRQYGVLTIPSILVFQQGKLVDRIIRNIEVPTLPQRLLANVK